MSEKQPRWNYWSRGVCDSDYFELEKVGALGAEIGIEDSRSLSQLQHELREYAVQYWLERQMETAPDSSEIAPALRKLHRDIARARSTLENLDQQTRRCIMNAYRKSRRPDDLDARDMLQAFHKGLRRFEMAVQDANLRLPPGQSGRPRLATLRDLALCLAQLYERRTGSQWTYDQPVDRRREHISATHGASWVSRLILHIDPKVTDANLDTVLREVPQRLRESRKPPSSTG